MTFYNVQYTTGKRKKIILPTNCNIKNYMFDPKNIIHKYQEVGNEKYIFVANLTPETLVHDYAIRNPQKKPFFTFNPDAIPTIEDYKAVKENIKNITFTKINKTVNKETKILKTKLIKVVDKLLNTDKLINVEEKTKTNFIRIGIIGSILYIGYKIIK